MLTTHPLLVPRLRKSWAIPPLTPCVLLGLLRGHLYPYILNILTTSITELRHMILYVEYTKVVSPLNAELNPICHLLALLGGATIVVVSRLRVNNLKADNKCISINVNWIPYKLTILH
jgi:hypothetical protein